MWHDLLTTGIPYGEKALRTILVYTAVIFLLRAMGRRDLAQLNTFDLVVMLLLSNVVQNAVIGQDDSLAGGLFGAAVLLAANSAVVHAASRFERVRQLLEGRPLVLVEDGRPRRRTIARLGLRTSDVRAAVRRQGGDDVGESSLVTLEPGGTLLVKLKAADQSADKADIDELRTALRRIERRLDAAGTDGP